MGLGLIKGRPIGLAKGRQLGAHTHGVWVMIQWRASCNAWHMAALVVSASLHQHNGHVAASVMSVV